MTISDVLDTSVGPARPACRPDLTVCQRRGVVDRT